MHPLKFYTQPIYIRLKIWQNSGYISAFNFCIFILAFFMEICVHSRAKKIRIKWQIRRALIMANPIHLISIANEMRRRVESRRKLASKISENKVEYDLSFLNFIDSFITKPEFDLRHNRVDPQKFVVPKISLTAPTATDANRTKSHSDESDHRNQKETQQKSPGKLDWMRTVF